MTMKQKTYTGVIDSKLEPQMSQNGKPYMHFVFKTKDSLVPCVCFDEMVEEIIGGYTTGETCTLLGSIKSDSDELYIKHFRTSKVETDKVIRWYGSKENYRKYHEALEAEMLKKGYIKIGDGRDADYVKEDQCVLHNGEPKSKVDYCMDILGASYVTKRLRAKANKDFIINDYSRVLEELVNEAKQKENLNVVG